MTEVTDPLDKQLHDTTRYLHEMTEMSHGVVVTVGWRDAKPEAPLHSRTTTQIMLPPPIPPEDVISIAATLNETFAVTFSALACLADIPMAAFSMRVVELCEYRSRLREGGEPA